MLADPALKAAIGSGGNVYAITTLWATVRPFPLSPSHHDAVGDGPPLPP